MDESGSAGTHRDVVAAGWLYGVTILGAKMAGPAGHYGTEGNIVRGLLGTAWLVLVTALAIRAIYRAGRRQSGCVVPALTVVFMVAIVMNLVSVARELMYAWSENPAAK